MLPEAAGQHGRAAVAGEIDTAPLSRGFKRLGLELPDGREITLTRYGFERRGPGDVAWRGRVAGDEASQVVLTLKHGFVFGTIQYDGAEYEIRAGHGGEHVVEEIDPESRPDDRHIALPDGEFAAPDGGALQSGELSSAEPVASASASEIHLLATYTPQARAAAGGTGQIEALIQSMVDYANTALVNSDMQPRFVLAAAQAVAYADTGDMQSDLNWLRQDADVRALRDGYGADLVSLIVADGGSYCGIAYVMANPDPSFESYAFQVTDADCGGTTFTHEHGHNLGMEHDPDNSRRYPDGSSYPWSYGHYVDGSYRTVMSYSLPCAMGCPRVPQFSNPDILFNGVPTGIAEERDNARTGDLTAPIVALFRDPVASNRTSVTIAIGPDDAEERASDGSVSLGDADLDLAYDAGEGGDQLVGLRFAGVSIPQGAQIVGAFLDLQADAIGSAITGVDIEAEASADAPAFAGAVFDLSGRPTTLGAVSWSIPAWTVVGERHESPDLAAVVQELVDDPGWRSGNAMVFLLSGTGRRVAASYDGDAAGAATLRIEWTAPSNSPPAFDAGSVTATNAVENEPYGDSLAGDASDPDGDLLTFSKVSGPAWLQVASNGALSGTPAIGEDGDNVFIVRVSDGTLSDDATLTIRVAETLKKRPPTPANFRAMSPKRKYATARWSDVPNESYYRLKIKKRKDGRWVTLRTVKLSRDWENYWTKLKPGRYRFRLRAVNGYGSSPWTAWAKVRVR
ncbi:MAG: M12 family metallo-peptidase [Rhodospirillales bacterium]|nr:M12 family metallo-peptidase [Rhodospirillales bacterium]